MKLNELDTIFEKKRIITYNTNQTKAVYHNKDVRHIVDNIYCGKSSSDGYNEYCDIYMIYPEIPVGIWAGSVRDSYSVEEVKETVVRAKIDTVENFLDSIKNRVKISDHIRFTEIELMKYIQPNMEHELWESRRIFAENREKKLKEREKKIAEENEIFVKEMNDIAQKDIDSAISIIKNGGNLENNSIEIFKDRYNSKCYSIINYLFVEYGIEVPIKTKGWISEKLRSVYISNGHCTGASYMRRNGGKCSSKIFDYMEELIVRVCKNGEE